MKPPDIRLDNDSNDECPRCQRPLLGLAAGACAYCETPFGPWLEDLSEVLSRLDEIAPGWTPERLRQWIQPRPAQLAWAFENHAWAHLGSWMDEELRGGLARLEMSRRGRGRGTRFDHVEVSAIHLQALGDTSDWVALRLEGRRRAAPFDLPLDPASRMREAGEGDESLGAEDFLEWWSLRPTGRPDRGAESICQSCGAPVDFEMDHCRHCGDAPPREPGPWLVEGIVTKGRGEGSRRLHLQGRSAFMPTV